MRRACSSVWESAWLQAVGRSRWFKSRQVHQPSVSLRFAPGNAFLVSVIPGKFPRPRIRKAAPVHGRLHRDFSRDAAIAQDPSSTAIITVLLEASRTRPPAGQDPDGAEGQLPAAGMAGAHAALDCGSGETTLTGTDCPSGTPGGIVTVMS